MIIRRKNPNKLTENPVLVEFATSRIIPQILARVPLLFWLVELCTLTTSEIWQVNNISIGGGGSDLWTSVIGSNGNRELALSPSSSGYPL
jgi:hypothetical protein